MRKRGKDRGSCADRNHDLSHHERRHALAPSPLITRVSDDADPQPTLAIIFNERSAPDQVADLISRGHAFVGFESFETV